MSSPAPATEPTAKPAKSKKMLIIGGVLLLLLVAGGGAAWFLSQRHGPEDGEGGAAAAAASKVPLTAPTFLPLDNMVVNLADPGGDRFLQLGITLELADDKTAADLKKYLPSVRSGILVLASQRTSTELLTLAGKEKLAIDVQREVARPLGFKMPAAGEVRPVRRPDEEEAEPAAPRKPNPVRRVLFSSFIIQ